MTSSKAKKQTTTFDGTNLKLDVENFGPIAEAKNIEFKPMTVFVGPSNTGKSYLAILLHSLHQQTHQTVRAYKDFPFPFPQTSASVQGLRTLMDDIRRFDINSPPMFSTEAFNDPVRITFDHLTDSSIELLDSYFTSFTFDLRNQIDKSIKEYFEVKTIDALKSSNASLFQKFNFEITDNRERFVIGIDNPSPIHSTIDYLEITNGLRFVLDYPPGAADETMSDFAHYRLHEALINYAKSHYQDVPDSFYFPTGRTGILNSHRVLTSQMMENAPRYGIAPRVHAIYHRLAREFLQLLIDLKPIPRRVAVPNDPRPHHDDNGRAHIIEIASLIESSLLSGQVNVSLPEIGLPNFEYKRDGHIVPIFRASSMVTELAPIVLFLQNYVKTGDLLIIDEPEAHLHPEAQQQMAAALAFMVRSGLRVLITTHSHYMVEQLSAFVNASKLDEPTRKRALSVGGALGNEDIYLNEEETAVYSFQLSPEHGGSVVKEICLGEEFEYGPDDHSDAVTHQYNRLQRVLEAREEVEFGDMA